MQKILVVILLTTLLLVNLTPAHAQEPIRFSNVEINLWPEYDRASMLVIYRFTLSAGTTLPVNLSVRIPAAAGVPNAVAVKQTDGQLFTVQYEPQTSGDWQILSFTATMPEMQIEYYDPRLTKDGTQRNFTFTWPADHATDAMLIEFQQPRGASSTTITPGPVTSSTGPDGLTYFFKDIGAVPINQTFSLEASYQKATDDLTVADQPVQPTSPLPTTSEWQTSLLNALPWLVGIIGIGLIGGGVFWYWRTGQQRQVLATRRRTKRGRSTVESRASGDVYCHQCGNRAAAGDRFCRSCGAKLRLE